MGLGGEVGVLEAMGWGGWEGWRAAVEADGGVGQVE